MACDLQARNDAKARDRRMATNSHHKDGAHNVVEHEHGAMDIADHVRTFDGFIRFLAWTAGLSILVLIFMALTNA